MYAGDTDVTDPSVSLNCVVEVTIPRWSLFPTHQCGFSGFYMEEKKIFLKKPLISQLKMYMFQKIQTQREVKSATCCSSSSC